MDNSILPDEKITMKIIMMRSQKVMLDKDLATLFQVKPIVLRQAVRRNINRFPEDFMWTLSENEVQNMVSQSVIPSKSSLGGSLPMVFTEHGILMLANVLRSPVAIQVSIQIVRIFNKMRQMIQDNTLLYQKLHNIEAQLGEHNEHIHEIRYTIKQMLLDEEDEKKKGSERPIGFYRDRE